MPREENACADTLSKHSVSEPMEGTWLESLQEKSIARHMSANIANYWTIPIKDFILNENFPDHEKIARKSTPLLPDMSSLMISYIEPWVIGLC